jgi:hypothetical protein
LGWESVGISIGKIKLEYVHQLTTNVIVKWLNPIGIATHQPHLFSFAIRIKYIIARHEIL